jgi:xylan 1,4-beta-xylosidase
MIEMDKIILSISIICLNCGMKKFQLKNRGTAIAIFLTLLIILCKTTDGFTQSITNPILAGFYPDPSICRVGNDYYLINSSFAYYPGLPIFHSKDLLNWQQIGHVLNRPEQLNLDSAGVSRGLFAPAITYHKGTFYVVCTLVDKGNNFVVTATDPKGPWSKPAWLPEVEGIDPSIFFDADDKAYIVYNSIPPDNKSMHDGHRTIRMNEFDAKQLKVISDNKVIVNGGTDMSKKPVWVEGPHLLKKDNWYYLICAEGGTDYNHSEVVFRSKSVQGPFIPYDKNPILTQRNLDPKRKNPVTNTGHADFVETPDGKWWAVFLGCRPYEENYFNTGRETFMAPVEWKEGWPIINPTYDVVKYSYPIAAKVNPSIEKFSGNYIFKDNFDDKTLKNRYSFLRTVRENWHTINNGTLALQLRPQTCSGLGNPSFVGFRQPHMKGSASTALSFNPKTSNEKAGLLVFQNEQHYYFLCQSIEDNKPVVQLFKGEELIASSPISLNKTDLFLKIEAKGNFYSFYYATQKDNWQLLKDNMDGKFLSTQVAGGFVGSFYSMYATSNGVPSASTALYDWFECKGEDDVYKQR